MSFEFFHRRPVRTAEKSVRNYPGGIDSLLVGEVKKAPLQWSTTPRIRTEHELTRPKDFGWANGR